MDHRQKGFFLKNAHGSLNKILCLWNVFGGFTKLINVMRKFMETQSDLFTYKIDGLNLYLSMMYDSFLPQLHQH